jgi:hypothetical protein
MYQCKSCGNKKWFYEHNNMKTHIVLDEETGEVANTYDEFLECVEVVCEVCNAGTEDGDILNKDGDVIVFER